MGPPPGPPGGPRQPAGFPGGPGRPRGPVPAWRRGRTIALVTAAAAVAAGAVTFALTNHSTGGRPAAPQVVLQPVSDAGPDPFTDSVAAWAAAPSGAAGSPTVTVSVSAGTGAGLSVEGGQAGLYGGSAGTESCDVSKLEGLLAADPAKSRSWAGVEGIAPEAIGPYLRTLTPVVLRADTRVTNHGFSNGTATAFQSVLQAGTAVLVDAHGVPRVRCACGNPLLPPALTAKPGYRGAPWPSFHSQTVVAVLPAASPLPHLVVVDPSSGASFAKPVGPVVSTTPSGPAGGSHVPGSATAHPSHPSAPASPGQGTTAHPSPGASPSAGGGTGPATGATGQSATGGAKPSPGTSPAPTAPPSSHASPATSSPPATSPAVATTPPAGQSAQRSAASSSAASAEYPTPQLPSISLPNAPAGSGGVPSNPGAG